MPIGDIPEVEAEIRKVTRVIDGHWRETSAEAVTDLVDELDRMDEADRLDTIGRAEVVAAIAALLLIMRNRIDEPPGPGDRRAIRASARRLLTRGARSTVGLSRFQTTGPAFLRAMNDAEADIVHSSRARMRRGRMASNIDGALDDFLTNEEARRPRKPKGPQPVRMRRDGRQASNSRALWLADLNRTLSDSHGSRAEVDRWAYATHSVGAFHAARSRGVRVLFAVNNPPFGPDEATTKFCRWVHGRAISVERTMDKLRTYYDAVRQDDEKAAQRAWRLSGPGTGANANTGQIRRHFASGVGLPGYHHGRRTQVRERIEEV